MARFVSGQKVNPSNPNILGEDVMSLVVEGLGVGGAALLNDRVASPLISPLIPIAQGGVVGKIVDAGTTVLSAWGGGEVVSMIFGRANGHLVRRGGLLLAIAKAVGAVVPGYSLTSLPLPVQLPAGVRPQLPAGQEVASNNQRLGVGTIGL